MATVRERSFEVFRAHGLKTIFGNPGSTELPFLQNYPADFEYVLGLQEASVIALAVGYSFMKDEAAVVNLHTTAGTGNAMGAIVTDLACSSSDLDHCGTARSQANPHRSVSLGTAGRFRKALRKVERRASSFDGLTRNSGESLPHRHERAAWTSVCIDPHGWDG